MTKTTHRISCNWCEGEGYQVDELGFGECSKCGGEGDVIVEISTGVVVSITCDDLLPCEKLTSVDDDS